MIALMYVKRPNVPDDPLAVWKAAEAGRRRKQKAAYLQRTEARKQKRLAMAQLKERIARFAFLILSWVIAAGMGAVLTLWTLAHAPA